jgi:hypothetical protein
VKPEFQRAMLLVRGWKGWKKGIHSPSNVKLFNFLFLINE